MNAKKEPLQLPKARQLVAAANKLVSAKGKRVVEVDLKREKLTDEELAKLMIGPTGNLRAPTLVIGKTIVVGFDEQTYQKYLG